MESSRLRRQPTLPMESPSEDPPRKILIARRRLSKTGSSTLSTSSSSSITPLIKPSLSRRGTSARSFTKKRSSEGTGKAPSLTKKASITREMSDIATSAISLESGSHIGKTGTFSEDDIASDVDVTEIVVPSTFSKTGAAVVSTLRKSVSGTGSLSKKLSRKESSKASMQPPLPPLPPGGLVEVAFSFDTTGSMSSALNEVKGRIKDIVQKLQSDVPGIRIAIFAHGDYCDADKYIVKWIDFGASLPELHDFVNNCEDTYGGDGDECYELVLRRAHEVLSWTPGSKRSLVMIGDASPHEPGYKYGDFTNDINWRNECTKLKDMGVRIYGVAINAGTTAQQFYSSIAERTGGLMIPLNKFNLIFELMMAICYREGGDDLFTAYQEELKDKYGVKNMDGSLPGMFSGLGGSKTGTGLFGSAPTSLFGSAPTTLFGSPAPTGLFGRPAAKGGLFGKPKAYKYKKPMKTKTTKGTATKTAAAETKKKDRIVKGKKKIAEKKLREKMNDKKFRETKPLNRLRWSKWRVAMTFSNIVRSAKWVKWLDGYIIPELFKIDIDKPAVYEFGIKPVSRRKIKKYVVGFKLVDKLPKSGKWLGKLTGRKDVRERLKDAISKKAPVFIRRAVFPKRNKKNMEKVRKYLEQCNYAFGTSKKTSRKLKVRGGFEL